MPFSALTCLRRAVLAVGLVVLPAASMAQTPIQPEQRKAIEQIIREYLLTNPEILQEALAELEKRTSEAQKVAQKQALTTSRKALEGSPHDFVSGNPKGDVTLVEFFDYNCGYCKRALGDMRAVIAADPKVKVVFKDFPVLGPESVEAARVALAARRQLKGDKLFDYHSQLMDTRGRVNGERALDLAKEFGLDIARLKKDMEGAEVKAAIQENVGLGDKLGLTGTPAFIIGDEIIPGAVGAEPLIKAVSNTRQCGKAVC